MKPYKLKVKYTFEGTVTIKADTKDEAKEIFEKGFGGGILKIGKPSWTSDFEGDEGIVDWDFDVHPTNTVVK